jgi:segregation and condensation protein B
LNGPTITLTRLKKTRRSPAQQLRSVTPRSGLTRGASRWEPGEPKKHAWTRRLAPRVAPVPAPPDAWARDEQTARLEAILFLAREPITSRKLAQLAHLADGTEARTLIRRLNRLYDETGSAFRAEDVAGGFQLLSRPKFAAWLRRASGVGLEIRLSAPALETLAVVAYRQPVLRAEIEVIRGVDCGEILRQLMDRDLVRTAGRAQELGRPYRYATTKRFLQVFGLRHLQDLPRADLLRAPEAQAATPAAHTQNIQSRVGGIHENLARTNPCEDEEDFERDHHRPA